MNVFRSLRDLLKSVVGRDDSAEAEPEKKQDVKVKPAQRAQSSQGDGFDAGSRGPRVDLRGGQKKVPVLEVEEPQRMSAPLTTTDFNASLDDLPALFDAELEEQVEFIPPGGMSTESLMQEFATLDPVAIEGSTESASIDELRRAAADPNSELKLHSFRPPTPVEPATVEPATVEPATVEPATVEPATVEPATVEPATVEPATVEPATIDLAPSAAVPSASLDLAEFSTPESTFAFDASSLSESSFESAPAEPAPVEPVVEQSSFEESSFEESSFTPASSAPPSMAKPARLMPAWLVPATTAAKTRAAPSGPDFSASLDDLGLLVEQPAPEPEAPAGQPSPQPSPPRGEGDVGDVGDAGVVGAKKDS